ncbi:MAG: 2OG-Fe(II) oxygenase [Rhizobiaceae bacterium]
MSVEEVKKSILASFAAAEAHSDPYPYFLVSDVVPKEMLPDLQELPFPAPDLEGVSGTREVHNKSRNYFDAENCDQHNACGLLAEALQSNEVVAAVQSTFNTDLSDTFLRIEYAQDTDGFWLEPHTDIGVKSFTMLLYLSDGEGHEKLGTSIYADKETHVGESPFAPNLAMIFVPSNHTWHGFEARKVNGVRKSIIINYVTQDWRAREQLAFPESTVPVG